MRSRFLLGVVLAGFLGGFASSEKVWEDEWDVAKKRTLCIVPLPRHIRGSGELLTLPNLECKAQLSRSLAKSKDLNDFLAAVATEMGLAWATSVPGIQIFLLTPKEFSSGGSFLQAAPVGPLASGIDRIGEEGYWLKVVRTPSGAVVYAVGNTERAVYYALQTLRFFKLSSGKPSLPEIEILDYPAFKVRAVLEGGYGAWPFEERIRIFPFEGRLKMNGYLYGPKAVPSFRNKWRRLYTSSDIHQFKQEIAEARRSFLTYSFSLSPAVRPSYASDRTLDILTKKFGAIQDLGVKDFGLLFDDILPTLSSPEDAERYESVGEAQADLTNRLCEVLEKRGKVNTFFFTPSQYAGTINTNYMQAIKKTLREDIYRGWTGPSICSFEIRTPDLQTFIEIAGGRVAIGDNHPVNRPLCLGPLRNRDADLCTLCDSFASNPLTESIETQSVEASKIALATIADYCWNPWEYDPDWSWEQALLLFGGKNCYPWLRALAEQNQKSCCEFSVPSAAKSAAEKYLAGEKTGEVLLILKQQFTLYVEATSRLSTCMVNASFISRVRPELQALDKMGRDGLRIVQGLMTYADPKVEAELKELVEKMQ